MSRFRVLQFGLLTAVMASGYGVMFTVLDDFRDEYGIREAWLGLIVGIGFLTSFVAQIFLAPAADRGYARRLVTFGMIPEVIGRLPMIGAVGSLDREALVKILVEPKNSLVKQDEKVVSFEDVELEFTPDGLEAVADQAILRGTGARGLRAILEEVLLNTMYDLPGRTDIGKVVIDEHTVVEKVNPTLVPRSAGRQRKAAS